MGIGSFVSSIFGSKPTVSVLRLSGPIGGGGFGRGLTAARIEPLIERAFAAPRLAAVALAINSPGGSPVQSALIASRIRDFADKKKTPVLAFCEDVAASGGYWLACAGDEIFADENSVVGSIGVVSAGFGLDGAIARLGVERRVRTAGENKWRLDPFLPTKPEDEAWLADLQGRIRESFIEYVKARRTGKLGESPPPRLFSGEAFLGSEAVGLGLIDGIGRLRPIVEARFGDRVRISPVEMRKPLLSRIFGAQAAPALDARDLASEVAAGLLDEAERRAMMARHGGWG